MAFQSKLDAIIQKNNSLVCVGLDSDISKIPESFQQKEHLQFEFNKAIIDATVDLVCCYKPNSAFYEARGDLGIKELKMTCDYIKGIYPNVPIILDAKRADIGNTNNGYVQFAYNYLGVDAVTINPYLGQEAIKPFLENQNKGVIILCKTSNQGSGEFQDLFVGDKKLYEIVAEKVANEWNTLENCSLVVGATYPEELHTVRSIVGDMTLLIPGIGTQGGDVEKTIKAGINSKNEGLIINASRSILFASGSDDFAEKAREKTEVLKNEINQYRQ
ncbi:MAG TPA: orotidine-5'-phosphate decarboxylase [Candidatus Sulfotelmatobacter sp.]|nr:orotidine-5'-phosphate decarboxylase [Candidatus Sulfotelmatobacter sp.]